MSLLHLKMLCAKFSWNWPSRSSEKDFKIFANVFSLFGNYLSLEKGLFFIWTILKPHSTIANGALCYVWLKLAQRFWGRRFLIFVNILLLFCNFLPLAKSVTLHLHKVEFPSLKDALCQVWLKVAQWFRRRRWKCEKLIDVWQTTENQTRGPWATSLTWEISLNQ